MHSHTCEDVTCPIKYSQTNLFAQHCQQEWPTLLSFPTLYICICKSIWFFWISLLHHLFWLRKVIKPKLFLRSFGPTFALSRHVPYFEESFFWLVPFHTQRHHKHCHNRTSKLSFWLFLFFFRSLFLKAGYHQAITKKYSGDQDPFINWLSK